tara:strand:- start:326 stop:1168 length:843 start_codon:yes stop_codon:yes gene_type:complete
MKILILGSTGILGRTLFFYLKSKKIIFSCISRKKKNSLYLKNFRNISKLKKMIKDESPTHLVNCLGVTKFSNSYHLKEQTKYINTLLPKKLAKFCFQKKIYFIHISTDCVFSGKKGNYTEKSKKDAKDLYGKSKAMGEVKNKYCSTIRTSFIGPETMTRKSLLNWFLSRKKKVNGYENAFFSGLTSLELSKIIYNFFILKNKHFNKILNIGGNKISKFLLLSKINKIFKKKIIIEKSSYFRIDRSLNSLKFQRSSGYKIQNWNKMLAELKFFMKKNSYKF